MQSKYFTIVIVPDSESQFKQLKISHRMIRGFIGGTVFSLLSLALFAVSYVELFSRSRRLDASIPETRILENQISMANKQLAQAMGAAELANRKLSEKIPATTKRII
jgi:hypothetical protein